MAGQRKLVLMDYESVLLTKVIQEGCIKEVIDGQFKAEFITENKELWSLLYESYRQHGGVPPQTQIEEEFPRFKITPSDVKISLVLEELRKRWLHGLAVDGLKEQAKLLKDRQPDEAIECMRKVVAQADLRRISRDVNLTEKPLDRVQEYEEIVKADGMIGLPTPWQCLNEVTLGIQSTDLVMFAGRSKVGKTWSEVVLSVFHHTLGYKPIIFSREMAVKQMVRRCDAVYSGLPYKRFRAGLLTDAEREKWIQTLKNMEGGLPFIITGEDEGRLTVSGVRAKIEKYQPDIVYIDGAYLIEDERGAQSKWERFSNVCEDLHRLTMRLEIPVVVTHQFNLAGKGDKGDDDTLKFGDVKMWFDIMIGLYQNAEMKQDREMLLKVLKNREGEEVDWVANWDLDKMDFEVKHTDQGGDDRINPEEVLEY